MSRLRIAVIGAGHLGRIHTRLLHSNDSVELVGVVDPLPASRRQVAAEFGIEGFAAHAEVVHRIDAGRIQRDGP